MVKALGVKRALICAHDAVPVHKNVAKILDEDAVVHMVVTRRPKAKRPAHGIPRVRVFGMDQHQVIDWHRCHI